MIPSILRPCSLCLTVISLLAIAAPGQTAGSVPVYRWTTIVGRSSIGLDDGPAADARFNNPHGLARDSAGNLYVADTGNHTIRKITPAGIVSTFAGSPTQSGSADGTGAAARFNGPQGLAIDRNGNLYVADTGNHTIRKITPDGGVTTLAGQSGQAGTADGAASAALFDSPDRLTVDQQGNVYLSNHGVRKISGGTVTTLSIPTEVTDLDGRTLTVMTGRCPAVDAEGNLYFTALLKGEYLPGRVTRAEQFLKLSSNGSHTVIRDSSYGTDNSGNTYAYRFYDDTLFNDYAGNLYLAVEIYSLWYPRVVRGVRMLPDGTLLTDNTIDFKTAYGAPFTPTGLTQDSSGKWFFTGLNTLYTKDGVYAGTDLSPEGADGAGSTARLSGAAYITVDGLNNIWVAEAVARYLNDPPSSYGYVFRTRVRKITSGVMTTPAQPWYPSSFSSFDRYLTPTGIASDGAGTVTLIRISSWNSLEHRVNQLFPNGSITEMNAPSGYVDDPVFADSGNLYALNWTNVFISSDPPPPYHRVAQRLDNGQWETLAGGPSDEILDGTGSAARFKDPHDLTRDPQGNLYLIDVDYAQGRLNGSFIRKITPQGVVTTVSRKLPFDPTGLAADGRGRFYITHAGSYTVTCIDTTGAETVIGGVNGQSGSRDGVGGEALFAAPSDIAFDFHDNLYVIDGSGTTIRKGEFLGYASTPSITGQPQSQTVTAGGNTTFSVTVSGLPPPTYQWHVNDTAIPGAISATLTLSNVRASDAGDYTVVVTNSVGSATSNKATLTVNTPAPTPPPAGGGSGGGGGAPSWWALAALAGAGLARRLNATSKR